MTGFIESLPPQAVILVPFILLVAWMIFRFQRKWRDVHRGIGGVLDTAQRLSADIGDLPWVHGTITGSRVQPVRRSTAHHHSADMYQPALTYHYEVDRREYSGSSDSLAIASADPGMAEAIVAKYPPGARVRVHFRPEDPSVSYIGIDEIRAGIEQLHSQFGGGIRLGIGLPRDRSQNWRRPRD